jgi:ABC-type uncharacterized transport system YnjBCD ATPase subunit
LSIAPTVLSSINPISSATRSRVPLLRVDSLSTCQTLLHDEEIPMLDRYLRSYDRTLLLRKIEETLSELQVYVDARPPLRCGELGQRLGLA